MARCASDGVREPDSVKRKSERSLDARSETLRVTEKNDTGRVNLGLDERRRVEVRLGANLGRDGTLGGLGVPDGLSANLDLRRDAVVVRRREDRSVTERVDGGGVGGGGVADRTGVLRDGAGKGVDGRLGSDEEAVLGEDSVGGDRGALRDSKKKAA